jgi:hypothetical protein
LRKLNPPVPEALQGSIAAGISAASEKTGLDPKLIAGVMARETGGMGAKAYSNEQDPNGAGKRSGIMQMDDNPKQDWDNSPESIAENILSGSERLKKGIDAAGGNLKAGLRHYNSGEQCVANGTAFDDSLWENRTGWGNTPTNTGDPQYATGVLNFMAQMS